MTARAAPRRWNWYDDHLTQKEVAEREWLVHLLHSGIQLKPHAHRRLHVLLARTVNPQPRPQPESAA